MRFPTPALFLVLATPAIARAEAGLPPADCVITTAPSDGQKVPPNLPAFAVTNGNFGGVAVGTFLSATLAGSNPATLTQQKDPRSDATLYVLDKPLDPMAMYGLDVKLDCQGAQNPGPRESMTQLGTIDATPLPTTSGTLKFIRMDSGYSNVELTLSTELARYLPVALFEVLIDGTSEGQTLYGHFTTTSGAIAFQIGRYGAIAFAGSQICTPSDTGMKTVQLEVRAHVAGAMTDPPPVTLATPIDCSKPPNPPPIDTANPPNDPVGSKSSGCTAAPAGTEEWGPLLGLAIAFGLIAARRRRG